MSAKSHRRYPGMLENPPNFMMCPITHELMTDPVIARDTHSYERNALQEWFDSGNTTSPLTREIILPDLIPNQNLKTVISEWVEDQLQGRADLQQLTGLKGKLFSTLSKNDALALISRISTLVTSSTLCVLGERGIETMKVVLEHNLGHPIGTMLDELAAQCHTRIQMKQLHYNEKLNQFAQLELFHSHVKNQKEKLKNNIRLLETQIAATHVLNESVSRVTQEQEETKRKFMGCTVDVMEMEKLCTAYSNEKDVGSISPCFCVDFFVSPMVVILFCFVPFWNALNK